MKRSFAILWQMSEFSLSHRFSGDIAGEANPRNAAWRLDISSAAGMPLPATSPMHMPRVSLAERKDVIVVAADDACGLPGAGNFESLQLRNFFRKKSLLDGAGFGDLAILRAGDFAAVCRLRFAALAADLHLLLQNFEQAGIHPGLFDEVADALLHSFDGQTDRAPNRSSLRWEARFRWLSVAPAGRGLRGRRWCHAHN